MYQFVDVDTGQIAIRQGRFILRANAIGSCIAVALYEPESKVGGIAHIMLPGCATDKADVPTKYARDGIEQMLEQMIQIGAVIDAIEACLVGAGNVLRKEDDTICGSNIHSVNQILDEKKIPVSASNLGGYDRKSAQLNILTGELFYTQGDGPLTLLWTFPDTFP